MNCAKCGGIIGARAIWAPYCSFWCSQHGITCAITDGKKSLVTKEIQALQSENEALKSRIKELEQIAGITEYESRSSPFTHDPATQLIIRATDLVIQREIRERESRAGLLLD